MSKPIDIPNKKNDEELYSVYQNYVIFDKDNIKNEEIKYYKMIKGMKNLGLSKSLPTYSSSPSLMFNPLLNNLNNNIESNSSNLYSKSEDTNCLLDYMSIYMDITSSDSDKDNENNNDLYDDYMFPREVFENVAKKLIEDQYKNN